MSLVVVAKAAIGKQQPTNAARPIPRNPLPRDTTPMLFISSRMPNNFVQDKPRRPRQYDDRDLCPLLPPYIPSTLCRSMYSSTLGRHTSRMPLHLPGCLMSAVLTKPSLISWYTYGLDSPK